MSLEAGSSTLSAGTASPTHAEGSLPHNGRCWVVLDSAHCTKSSKRTAAQPPPKLIKLSPENAAGPVSNLDVPASGPPAQPAPSSASSDTNQKPVPIAVAHVPKDESRRWWKRLGCFA